MSIDKLIDISGLERYHENLSDYIVNNFTTKEESAENSEVIAAALVDLNGKIEYINDQLDVTLDNIINIIYSELVSLRDNSQLMPGQQYRITDYVTTTTQTNTQSAGHQFDIIVTADDESTLNEVARACISEFDIEKYKDAYSNTSGVKMQYVGLVSYDGKEYHLYEAADHTIQMLVGFNAETSFSFKTREYPYSIYPSYTRWNNEGQWSEWYYGIDEGEDIAFKCDPTIASYFKDSNLNAWQIWYCLDNDTERFEWASNKEAISNGYSIYYRNLSLDTTNNGVLYYAWFSENENTTFYTIKENPTEGEFTYDDTFVEDWEIIKVITKGKGVIYRMIDEFNNDCPYDFKNIQFKHPNDTTTYPDYYYTFSTIIDDVVMDHSLLQGYCYDNIIKEYINSEKPRLNNNVFLNTSKTSSCNHNSFGYNCYSNSFGNDCYDNSFGNDCYDNSFGNDCYDNSFGYNCYSNSFGGACEHNSFGYNCYSNSFGDKCTSNSFGMDCYRNSFVTYCYMNSFGSYCYSNSFGFQCSFNSFGNQCSSNSFGKKCSSNSFGKKCSSNSFGDNCDNNSFGNSCRSNSFRVSADKAATLKDYVQYNHFDDGCSYNVIWNIDTTSSSVSLQNININRGVRGTSSSYNMINIDTLNSEQEIEIVKTSDGIYTYTITEADDNEVDSVWNKIINE